MSEPMVIGLYVLYFLTLIIAGIQVGWYERKSPDNDQGGLPSPAKFTLVLGFVFAVLIAAFSDAPMAIKLSVALLGLVGCFASWFLSLRILSN